MKTKSFLILCIVIMRLSAISQVKIGDNVTNINSNSLLELQSANKGFVLPRVSITDISSPVPLAAGLLTGTVVYNTNSGTTGGSGAGIYYWDGTQWNFLANTTITGNYWSLTGNSGTNPSSNFIGTTDAKDFVVRTNNVERMRILGATVGSSQVGWIGMGISTTPKSALDVAGNYSGKNVITIQNTSITGFSSVDMLDNSGNLATTFGFANSGTGTAFSGKAYLNGYGNDFLFTRGSSYDLIMKGSNGYVGLNTSTPSERLHVVGNFYLAGAFMPAGDAGTSGYLLTSAGANTSPTWTNPNSLAWRLTGNSGTNASTNFMGTTDAVDFVARTSNIERLRITSTGNVGIGLTNPSYKLAVLSASNPLYLSGVQATGTFTADSILTINGGVVKKSPYSSLLNLGWSLTGNNGTNASTNFIGTTDAVDFVARTSNTERLRITSAGKVGIGLSNPTYALSVLSASNPLYLSGVQATSTFSADSILTINSGIVKKTPYSSLNTNWSLTGNSGTDYATNFLGTTDNVSLRFRTNNIERMIIDSIGNVSIGNSGAPTFNASNPPIFSVDYGTTTSNTIAYLRGSVDDYFQINLRNKSNSIYASTDYVATSDDGTDSTNYIDFGINSSTYAPGVENWGGPHDAYLYSNSRNLLIGSQSNNSDLIFLLNGGRTKTNTVLRIEGETGNIIVGTGNNQSNATGNIIRGPNGGGTNIAGGGLTLQGGSATGTATGGNLNLYGGSTVSGTKGVVNINTSNNSATNINTGTSTSTVTIGNSLNNINLPRLSALSVVLTDASKNLTSTTPSSNTYLYYDGANFTWQSAATLASFSVTAPLTYNNLTGVFGITKANTTTDGYLSSTDWNTFNNKVGSITLNTPSSVFSNPVNFSVSSGTATGTLSLNTQTANTVFAGPASGAVATPTFRALVAADIPSLAGNYIQNQITQQASSNYNISGTGTLGGLLTSNGGQTNSGTFTTSGGIINMNVNSNFAANINTGTSTGNVTIGNSSNNILLPKFNTAGGMIYTTAATGQIASTGSNMKWDDVNNRLGIGLTNPSYKLSVLAASDPLYLSGVQATSTFSSDSILTINAGVVKKTPYSSLPSGSSGWSLTGNSGTTAGTNFLGTTDAQPLVIKSLNRQLAYFDGNLYSIALGYGAVNGSSDHNVAIGYNATTNNQYTLALGYNATATGVRSVAIGNGASATTASGAEAVAIGYNAVSSAAQTVSLGYQALASGLYGVAIGYGSQATASQTTAIGYSSLASAQYANAIGYQAQSTGLQSTAIGYKAQTAQSNTILLGDVSTSNLYVGIGTATPSSKLDIVAQTGTGVNPLEIHGVPTGNLSTDYLLTINNTTGIVNAVPSSTVNGTYWNLTGNAAASGSFLGTTNTTPLQFKFNSTAAGYLDANNTAFGTGYSYSGTLNTAIGYSSNAANSATAVGANSDATGLNNTAIGNSASANTSSQATAIGASSQAVFQNNTAVGYNAQATTSSQETVIGASSQAQGQNNIAIGYSAKATNSDKITVVGSNAQASFQNNTVVGSSALATTNNQATAIGASAVAQAQNATALGYNASASGTNSTAIGYNAATSQNNALVLGTGTTNVGIATSTPATTASLDVNGKFKLGDIGTVNKNVVSFSSALGSTSITAGTGSINVFAGSMTFSASSTDVTITIPAAANYLTSTQATVTVSPNFDLPTSVSIASARMISTSQLKIRFVNSSTTAQTISGNLYITINEF